MAKTSIISNNNGRKILDSLNIIIIIIYTYIYTVHIYIVITTMIVIKSNW